MIITKYERVKWEEASSLAESVRGDGGFGIPGLYPKEITKMAKGDDKKIDEHEFPRIDMKDSGDGIRFLHHLVELKLSCL